MAIAASTLQHYDLGEPWQVTSTFSVAGINTDPTTVSAIAVDPTGAETTYTYPSANLTKTGTGVYVVSATASVVGTWYVLVTGTGAAAAKERHEFVVDPRLPGDTLATYALTTVEKAERYLGDQGISIRSTERDQDIAIAEAINSYSQAINDYCNRRFKPTETAATHTFTYEGKTYLGLAPYEIRTATTIVLYSDQPSASQWTLSSTPPADYTLMPREKSILNTYTWLELPRLGYYRCAAVAITGDWGPAAVPSAVERACLIAVANNFRSPEGFASRQLGPLAVQEFPELTETPGQSLPPDSRALLGPYRL
jgi:hypothetical protein